MNRYYTLSLDEPSTTARCAADIKDISHLKLKLGGGALDCERMRAVRQARPGANIVVDANEAWQIDDLPMLFAVAQECAVELIEQPLPAGRDSCLATMNRSVPVCADESAEPGGSISRFTDRYDAVNIKLDKSGGLTRALQLVDEAQSVGLSVFVGSMVATSLGIAPAVSLAARAQWIDLDSPMLLAKDRRYGLRYVGDHIDPPERKLWG